MSAVQKFTEKLHGARQAWLGATLLAVCPAGWCYDDGAPAAHTGGFGEPDCSQCHSDNAKNAADGRLEVSGLPKRYTPGERYELEVILQHPELKSGGFQLSIRTSEGEPAGKLGPTSERTDIVSRAGQPYLQHTREGRLTGEDGIVNWSFVWQAPDRGEPLVLNVAANAANDDLSALGDHIFTLQKKLKPTAGSSAE